jgi:hypothetical protein
MIAESVSWMLIDESMRPSLAASLSPLCLAASWLALFSPAPLLLAAVRHHRSSHRRLKSHTSAPLSTSPPANSAAPLPFLTLWMMLFNSCMWMSYYTLQHDHFLNSSKDGEPPASMPYYNTLLSLLVVSAYVFMFERWIAVDKWRIRYSIAAMFAVLFCLASMLYVIAPKRLHLDLVGILANLVSIAMLASPLSVLVRNFTFRICTFILAFTFRDVL